MSSEFADFAEAASRSAGAPVSAQPALDRVCVLGGGPDARLLAALCLSEGADVTLFSAYGAELDAMRAASGIALRGAGPVGTYQVDQSAVPSVRTTAELDRAVSGSDVIFLTGPVHKQRTYAMVLAAHLRDGQVLVLAPGRSLGALETAWNLRIGGATADVTIVEVQGLPYWYAADGMQLKLSEAAPVAAATLPSGRDAVLDQIRRYLPNIQPKASVVASGFADGSALVELPALILGGPVLGHGGPAVPEGGITLPANQTFAALIGDAQHRVIAALAEERRSVADRFGLRDLHTDAEWVAAHAGAMRGDGARPIPNPVAAQEMLRDGVIASLVPLLSAARLTNAATPVTEAMVALAQTLLGADVAAAGRRLDTIGVTATDIDDARRVMDRIATGAR